MSTENKKPHFTADTSDRAKVDEYDPHIIPAETAARKEREGEKYKTLPTQEGDNPADIDTSGGYTVDKEGLVNNYAIEPEMYVNEPGDLSEENEELTAERAREIQGLKGDEKGKLTMEEDARPRGQGAV